MKEKEMFLYDFNGVAKAFTDEGFHAVRETLIQMDAHYHTSTFFVGHVNCWATMVLDKKKAVEVYNVSGIRGMMQHLWNEYNNWSIRCIQSVANSTKNLPYIEDHFLFWD